MMKHFSFFLISLMAFLPSLILFSCQKGKIVDFQNYLKLNIGVYCEDTSLYVNAAFNDSTFYTDASMRNEGVVFPLYAGSPAEIPHPKGDSGKLKITVIKKNYPNLTFDSIINIANYNDLILMQLNPLSRPYLINKKTAGVTIPKPTEDSIKVRFFFSSYDPTIRNNNYSPSRPVTTLDLELWIKRNVNGVNIPVNINRKIRINANQLAEEYISLSKGDLYGWRLLDVSADVAANMRVIETYEYDPGYELFTRGYIELDNSEMFKTIKITQTFENLYSYQYGINGKFLFGFN